MFIVDAHLDLSYNALRGREVLRPAAEQTADAEGIPTVGLPDLRAGGVDLVCATIFCAPSIDGKPGYVTPDEARAAGMAQLAWYQEQVRTGQMRIVRDVEELPKEKVEDGGWRIEDGANGSSRSAILHPLSSILLLEGADPLRGPEDVADWVAAGMRVVGLAWKRTRYAGGTGAPGPLTPAGVDLVRELDRFDIIHDASHLAEASFWHLLDLSPGRVIASHSNCRQFVPTDRQLSDDMIRAIFGRGGVIGINFFDKFLLRPEEYGHRRATLSDVLMHMRHMCDLAGDAKHVAIGTDMDGGLGRDEIPVEIRTSADLPRLAETLSEAGFSDADVRDIMGGNWLNYFRSALPQPRRIDPVSAVP